MGYVKRRGEVCVDDECGVPNDQGSDLRESGNDAVDMLCCCFDTGSGESE